jgi:YVTN family beta-propeller protein
MGLSSVKPIAINPNTNKVYVYTNNSAVAVIDGTYDYITTNIPIEVSPNSSSATSLNSLSVNPIAINPNTNRVYVANSLLNSVSVIDGNTDRNLKNVHVGNNPTSLAVNPDTNFIFVSNYGSDTISIIDGSTNKVVAGITFTITPPNSGHVTCDNKEYPTNLYLYIGVGTKCIAEPNKGFQFSSWTENLGHNSSKAISTSAISSNSPFDSLLNALELTPKDNAAIFNITHFGAFTANFKERPPPIPPEYWVPLYGVIISSIVGWSIPSIIGWIRAKKQGRALNQYHKRANSLYDDGKLDENDIESLDSLKRDIADAYAKGKISDQHYGNLKNEISMIYEEIYNKKIRLLNSEFGDSSRSSNRSNGILLDKIKNDIADAYAKGKISDQHYNLLNNKISDHENKQAFDEKLSSSHDNKSDTMMSTGHGSPIKINK